MNLFLNIARMLPMAILIAFAMASQTVAMSHHGAEHDSASQLFVTICADGELKVVAIGEDGSPSEHQHQEPNCPLCVLSKVFGSLPQHIVQNPARYAKAVSFSEHAKRSKVQELRPDNLQCLDPPRV